MAPHQTNMENNLDADKEKIQRVRLTLNIRMPFKRQGTSASATTEHIYLLLQGGILKDEGRRCLQYQGLQKAWLRMEKKTVAERARYQKIFELDRVR